MSTTRITKIPHTTVFLSPYPRTTPFHPPSLTRNFFALPPDPGASFLFHIGQTKDLEHDRDAYDAEPASTRHSTPSIRRYLGNPARTDDCHVTRRCRFSLFVTRFALGHSGGFRRLSKRSLFER
ncbi:hypothetical protein GWI33_011136 [Rhynchophorus ferrugineus]|uniref:Uncharacterized protein n=1 Tax=Rhynchophorus ferrugineus TaxID=354439 RepID=A0A834MK57_RHYFE|nr:hypothetical protein GWI33_011136 [Rhynchophorus ferrugineus]